MSEVEIGIVTNYFGKISVAGIQLSDTLSVGDTIHIKGHTTDLTEEVDSIQIDNDSVESAGSGKLIGLKVSDHVREHDKVYKLV